MHKKPLKISKLQFVLSLVHFSVSKNRYWHMLRKEIFFEFLLHSQGKSRTLQSRISLSNRGYWNYRGSSQSAVTSLLWLICFYYCRVVTNVGREAGNLQGVLAEYQTFRGKTIFFGICRAENLITTLDDSILQRHCNRLQYFFFSLSLRVLMDDFVPLF